VANESGASTQPWQTPASILNHELWVPPVRTQLTELSYSTLKSLTILSGIPSLVRSHNAGRLRESNAVYMHVAKVVWTCTGCEWLDGVFRGPVLLHLFSLSWHYAAFPHVCLTQSPNSATSQWLCRKALALHAHPTFSEHTVIPSRPGRFSNHQDLPSFELDSRCPDLHGVTSHSVDLDFNTDPPSITFKCHSFQMQSTVTD